MGVSNSPTWKQLEDRWDQGFDTLLREEQEAIALWWLEAETMNGTLNQFYWNNAGDMALLARDGLRSLGMPITLAALESTLAHFGDTYPLDRDARMAMLEVIEAQHGTDVFTPASRVIQDLPEDFVQAAVDRLAVLYARGVL